VWRLARVTAASGAVSSPVPAAGSPSGRANVAMSEVEGGWSDLLHESALEASSSQTSVKPASVPESGVTLPQQTRYYSSRVRKIFHFVMWRMSRQAGHMVRRSGGW